MWSPRQIISKAAVGSRRRGRRWSRHSLMALPRLRHSALVPECGLLLLLRLPTARCRDVLHVEQHLQEVANERERGDGQDPHQPRRQTEAHGLAELEARRLQVVCPRNHNQHDKYVKYMVGVLAAPLQHPASLTRHRRGRRGFIHGRLGGKRPRTQREALRLAGVAHVRHHHRDRHSTLYVVYTQTGRTGVQRVACVVRLSRQHKQAPHTHNRQRWGRHVQPSTVMNPRAQAGHSRRATAH